MTQPAALAPVTNPTTPRRGPGRPRHAETEPRAYRAALELFGRRGWAGLTLDGVATHAGIGKSSIYLRWRGKEDLLLDAVRDLQSRLPVPDTTGMGVRDYLLTHALARAELFRSDFGQALANLYAAAASDPEDFAELCSVDVARGMRTHAWRVEQAVADGELGPQTRVEPLLEAIEGAIFVHAVCSRAGRSDHEGGVEDFVATVVDVQLRGSQG
ncbi:TetR/AcrR family transcriptional regulator [Georgenia alba]|uniref:TetR/AcrR family transcriptional regulator n=1 Tax=Georgenia alba TaxID=2233858 RepID=A0ABW2Q975_9MICO